MLRMAVNKEARGRDWSGDLGEMDIGSLPRPGGTSKDVDRVSA